MRYFVISVFTFGNSELFEFDSKEEALLCVATNTGEDTHCRLIEGNEVLFKIKQIAEEVGS